MKHEKLVVSTALLSIAVIIAGVLVSASKRQPLESKTFTTCNPGNSVKRYHQSKGETQNYNKDLNTYEYEETALCAGLGKITLELHP